MKTLLYFALMFSLVVLANAQVDPQVLAAENEAKAFVTSKDPLTSQLIKDKVNAAVALLETEGLGALKKLQGKESEFIFSGTYLWVHSADNVMVMHPMKPKLNGKRLGEYIDPNGKLFFVDMTNLVKTKGSGWVDYLWPKPGATGYSQKISFVKGARVEGKLYIVGCGVYDFTSDQIKKLKEENSK